MPDRRELVRMRWVWGLGGLSVPQLTRRVGRSLIEEDTLGRTAELSYYFLLSLFPFLICLSTIAGLIFSSDRDLYSDVLSYMQRIMPGTAYSLVRPELDRVTEAAGGGRLSLALLAALWTASLGMEAIIKGLNDAYDVRERRAWWKRRLVAIGLTVVVLVLILSALGLLLWGQRIGTWLTALTPPGWTGTAWILAQWAIMIGFLLLALSLIYLLAPNLREQRWQALMPGALVALLVWLTASFGLRFYLSYFDTYSRTYGSLGAVIVLLLWLYLSGAAILVGGEVNAQIRNAAAEAGVTEARKIREAT